MASFYVSYIKKSFCIYDCVDALITACLQNDVLVFAFLFSHNVHYQYSAIMIIVGILNLLTPQPLSHTLPSTFNFNYMSPFSFFLSEKHLFSQQKKKPLIVKFPKLLLFSNFVSKLTIFKKIMLIEETCCSCDLSL